MRYVFIDRYKVIKQLRNQLKAIESFYNRRKELLGCKLEKKVSKHLNKIIKLLERECD